MLGFQGSAILLSVPSKKEKKKKANEAGRGEIKDIKVLLFSLIGEYGFITAAHTLLKG